MVNIYLVEILLEKWVKGTQRVICYEEVVAEDALVASQLAMKQFITRTKHEPIMRRKWKEFNHTYSELCTSDALLLDY